MTGDTPQPGFYKMRLVKNGVYVPVHIWDNVTEKDEAGDYLEDQGLIMLIDGEFINPQHIGNKWLYCMGDPIKKKEYDFMLADSDHAQKYRPDDVKSQPRKAINLSTQKSIF